MQKGLLLAALAFLLPNWLQADEGPDFWLTLNSSTFEIQENTRSKTHAELRFPEFNDFTYFRISQKFTTNLTPKWSLGTHPVFETSKKGNDWNNTYRLDLELNPAKFKLGEDGPTISMRNRWELRWKEGKGSTIFHRLRQSTKATWKIDAGPFTSYTIANEAFWEEDKGKVSMNRFYPIMLGSKLDGRKTNYYLLYQSKRLGTSSDWSGRFILGASLSF